MNERRALLKAIYADQQDDTVRLVYADFLDETGDPDDRDRAKFIRLQIDIARRRRNEPDKHHPECRPPRGSCLCDRCEWLIENETPIERALLASRGLEKRCAPLWLGITCGVCGGKGKDNRGRKCPVCIGGDLGGLLENHEPGVRFDRGFPDTVVGKLAEAFDGLYATSWMCRVAHFHPTVRAFSPRDVVAFSNVIDPPHAGFQRMSAFSAAWPDVDPRTSRIQGYAIPDALFEALPERTKREELFAGIVTYDTKADADRALGETIVRLARLDRGRNELWRNIKYTYTTETV